MTKSRLTSRILKLALMVAAGAVLPAVSCGQQLRDSVRGATMDFVKSSTSTVFQTLFPVKDMLAGAQ